VTSLGSGNLRVIIALLDKHVFEVAQLRLVVEVLLSNGTFLIQLYGKRLLIRAVSP
jgi:hypothetical protein